MVCIPFHAKMYTMCNTSTAACQTFHMYLSLHGIYNEVDSLLKRLQSLCLAQPPMMPLPTRRLETCLFSPHWSIHFSICCLFCVTLLPTCAKPKLHFSVISYPYQQPSTIGSSLNESLRAHLALCSQAVPYHGARTLPNVSVPMTTHPNTNSMYRQERSFRQSHGDVTSIEENGEVRRAPKTLPSGSQLPACWNEAMDRAICHMEAQNEVDLATMTRLLKRRFPELEGVRELSALFSQTMAFSG